MATHVNTPQEDEDEAESADGASIKNLISNAFTATLWEEAAVDPHYATGISTTQVTVTTTLQPHPHSHTHTLLSLLLQ